MSFNFDIALSKFKKSWAETPQEVRDKIRSKLLETIQGDDAFDLSLFKMDYDTTPFYRILENCTLQDEIQECLLGLMDITISANDNIYFYDDHNLGLAA